MRITIEIDDPYLKTLREWASAGRTLDAAKAMCEKIQEDTVCFSGETTEQAGWTLQELRVLGPALDHLHYVARAAIWAKDAEAKQESTRRRMSADQLNYYASRGETIAKVDGVAEEGNTITTLGGRVDRWVIRDGRNHLLES